MDILSERDLRRLLTAHGFKFSKSMGQNFLIDPGIPERIAESAGIDASFGVLEIGPGIGALTRSLSRRAAAVCAVELDKRLIPLLGETLSDTENVRVINGDILKLDIAATVSRELPGLRWAACANLPYNITTPAVTALFESACFERVTVMVQREVARRMSARPGTPDYGAFSVFVQYYARPELLFDVPPACFTPQPSVTSSVITMEAHAVKPVPPEDRALFFRVVRASFAQRRKTLVNALESAFAGLDKKALREIVTGCGFSELVRGETLGIPEFLTLSRALGIRLGGGEA